MRSRQELALKGLALVSNDGEVNEGITQTPVEESEEPEPGVFTPAPAAPRNVQWLPVGGIKAPKTLDGSLAGDVGFDPIGFAKSKDFVLNERGRAEALRLAMLAAVGWPMSELLHKEIAGMLNLPSILAGVIALHPSSTEDSTAYMLREFLLCLSCLQVS